MTVCTVGAAYLVNLASSGGSTLTVVLLLLLATLLTSVQVGLQYRKDRKEKNDVRDGSAPSDQSGYFFHLKSTGLFLWAWVWTVLVILTFILRANPETNRWMRETLPEWLISNWYGDWYSTPSGYAVNIAAVVAGFLVGVFGYWQYRKSYIRITSDAIEISRLGRQECEGRTASAGFYSSTIRIPLASITAIQIGRDDSMSVRYGENDNTTGTVRILEPDQESSGTGSRCLVITAVEAEKITGVVMAVLEAINDAHGSLVWHSVDEQVAQPRVKRMPGIRQPGRPSDDR
ncbi:MAG TPA: hypothetical protein VH969_31650 [Actinophytocola sp.]|uniref:hypothetical protein n=1 Tax=Actinophytocola sp. TaxID=1872138 RepID=UPI002F920DB9